MKKIVIENNLACDVAVRFCEDSTVIPAGGKTKIEIPEGEKLRAFKMRGESSQICRSEMYDEDDIRDHWVRVPILLLNTDAVIESRSLFRIELEEEIFLYHKDVVMSVITVNGKAADSYDFHDEKDKKKYKLYSFLMSLPLWILEAFLGLFTLGCLVTGVFLEDILIFLLIVAVFVIVTLICRSSVKTKKKFLNLPVNSEEIISDSPKVLLYKHTDKYIKFAPSEKENGGKLYE